MVIVPPRIGAVPAATPVIFLAGPIKGTHDWQAEAIKQLERLAPKAVIASPRGPEPFHGDFTAQVRWETHYLQRAAFHGVILFWLAAEREHVCDRSYAQTSRLELGEWLGNMIVVGIESGFSGARYIQQRIEDDYDETPIFDTLAATCASAARLAKALAKKTG